MVLGVWGTENYIRKQNEELHRLNQQAAELKQKNIELRNRKDAENVLMKRLLDAGKLEELKKSLVDEAFRQELLESHHLTS